MVGAVDGQLGTAQDGRVAAGGAQPAVDGRELLPGALLAPLDLVVDDTHDQLLHVGRGRHGLNTPGGALPLVDAGLNRAVGGQDAHPLFPVRRQHGHGLPGHVDEGDGDIPLEAVGKVVGGVAGDGQGGAAAPLQQSGPVQQAAVAALRVPAQDGGGAVGHGGIAPDQGGQVLLVAGGVGTVQNPLVEVLGGLGPHAAQNTKALFRHTRPSCHAAAWDPTPRVRRPKRFGRRPKP